MGNVDAVRVDKSQLERIAADTVASWRAWANTEGWDNEHLDQFLYHLGEMENLLFVHGLIGDIVD